MADSAALDPVLDAVVTEPLSATVPEVETCSAGFAAEIGLSPS
ncbi:hypothetical protein [Halosimplex salinum]|nr:hypothetical protein [Halosimplex salinum]